MYDSNLYLGVTLFPHMSLELAVVTCSRNGGNAVQEMGEQRKALAQRNQAQATDMTPSSSKYSCLVLP